MTSDDGQHDGGSGKEGGPGAAADPRLQMLQTELKRLRPADKAADGKPATDTMSGIGQAMKMGSEFIAGVIVGAVIGYSIDRLFGTTPWGMIIFLLLGFAAGTLNVMRSAGLAPERDGKDAGRKGGDGS